MLFKFKYQIGCGIYNVKMQPITKEACTLQQLVQKRLSGFINCDHNNAQIVLLRAQLLNWLMAVIYAL